MKQSMKLAFSGVMAALATVLLFLTGVAPVATLALPAIAVMEEDGNCKVIREFGYEDFKGRLA